MSSVSRENAITRNTKLHSGGYSSRDQWIEYKDTRFATHGLSKYIARRCTNSTALRHQAPPMTMLRLISRLFGPRATSCISSGLVLFSVGTLMVLMSVRRVTLANNDEASESHVDRLSEKFGNSSSPDRYVTLCGSNMYGNHRLGNHLFYLAAMLHVAELTNRRILIGPGDWCVDNVFQVTGVLRSRDNQSPLQGSSRVMHPNSARRQSLDENLSIVNGTSIVQTYTEQTLELCGLYQTTVFADAVEAKFRKMLRFKPDVEKTAAKFVDAACSKVKSVWNVWLPTRCIGVHVRRGDFLNQGEIDYGLTTISETYLHDAMQYFIKRYFQRVRFVITSDDQPWVRATLRELFPRSVASNDNNTFVLDGNVLVTLSVNQSAAVDFAVLTMCDGLVISTGSFGWWAAWLANKTTVYYANWPREGSTLDAITDPETYFPHKWIPIDEK